MENTALLEIFADVATIAAALAVIATTALVWRQMRIQAQGQDKDERRFLRETIATVHDTLQGAQFVQSRKVFFVGPHERGYDDLEADEKGAARYVLSVYALLERMVRHGVVDEKILRDYWKTSLYRDWDRLENFVSGERLRAKNGAMFSATEKMVARWKEADSEG